MTGRCYTSAAARMVATDGLANAADEAEDDNGPEPPAARDQQVEDTEDEQLLIERRHDQSPSRAEISLLTRSRSFHTETPPPEPSWSSSAR
jgi:hypothetical protein